MSEVLRIEGLRASALDATAKLLGADRSDAVYVALIFLGAKMVQALEDEGRELAELRESLRELVEFFEGCTPELGRFETASDIEDVCAGGSGIGSPLDWAH
jgi:hypothetical protein